jgi:O-antigen/teichoic acid export membrane protein
MVVGVRRIIVNTATGTGARVAALGIVFLTTPVLINHLGADAFGLLAIVAALPAYAGLLDLGIGPGLVRHLTEYSEYGDVDGVMEIMTLSLCFYMLLGIIFAPLVVLLAPDVIRLFSVPEPLRGPR